MLFNSGQIYRKDTQWTETNEKLFFLFIHFLFFELCLILYSKFIKKLIHFEHKNYHVSKLKISKSHKIDFHSFQQISHISYIHIWTFLKFWIFFVEKYLIHLTKINLRELGPPHPPLGLQHWIPLVFGLRTLASLVSVWIRFAKISHISKIKFSQKKLLK